MSDQANVDVGCRIIAEFIDEASAYNESAGKACEVQRPTIALRNREKIT